MGRCGLKLIKRRKWVQPMNYHKTPQEKKASIHSDLHFLSKCFGKCLALPL